MSDSMWKKEISFKRKPKADAEAVVEAAPRLSRRMRRSSRC